VFPPTRECFFSRCACSRCFLKPCLLSGKAVFPARVTPSQFLCSTAGHFFAVGLLHRGVCHLAAPDEDPSRSPLVSLWHVGEDSPFATFFCLDTVWEPGVFRFWGLFGTPRPVSPKKRRIPFLRCQGRSCSSWPASRPRVSLATVTVFPPAGALLACAF